MIEINLAPPEVRKKRKKAFLPAKFKIPMEVIVGSAGGLVVLLILVHFTLIGINISRKVVYKQLQARWDELVPAKTEVDGVIKEMRALQMQYDAIKDITQEAIIPWSEKLNIISDSLPKGVWLKRLSLTEETFLVDGSAISRKSNEMISVHSFIATLKAQERYLDRLTGLELGSIQRRYIKDIEIADFIISSDLQK